MILIITITIVGQYTIVCLYGGLARMCCGHVSQHTIMCLYGSLTHARAQVFIEVFRFAIERFIFWNKEE